MRAYSPSEWKTLRLSGTITVDGDVIDWETVRLEGVHHVVHEYANFVSSAEMVITGAHNGKGFDPPINTHLSHAFLLNARKMADFFGGRSVHSKPDDVFAEDYAPGPDAPLRTWPDWRDPINKQLTHITYTRGAAPQEIPRQAILDIYRELKSAWKEFRAPGKLRNAFAVKFEHEITDKLTTEFNGLDLW